MKILLDIRYNTTALKDINLIRTKTTEELRAWQISIAFSVSFWPFPYEKWARSLDAKKQEPGSRWTLFQIHWTLTESTERGMGNFPRNPDRHSHPEKFLPTMYVNHDLHALRPFTSFLTFPMCTVATATANRIVVFINRSVPYNF